MKKLKLTLLKIWDYFRNSWEGTDGKLSYRRVSQYIFLGCMTKMAFGVGVHGVWSFYTFLTFSILYTLVATIMTVEQIMTLLKFTLPALGKSPDNEPKNEEMPQEFVKDVIEQKT